MYIHVHVDDKNEKGGREGRGEREGGREGVKEGGREEEGRE